MRLLALCLLASCGMPAAECSWDKDCYRRGAAACGSCLQAPDGGCDGYARATGREHVCVSLCHPEGT